METPENTAADVESAKNEKDELITLDKLSKEERLKFVAKVYLMLTVQIISAAIFIAIFIYCEILRNFAKDNKIPLAIGSVFGAAILFIMIYYPNLARNKPWNFILFITFTLIVDYLCALTVSHFPFNEILIAAGLCIIITLLLTLLSFQSRVDFTILNGLLFTMIPILLILTVITVIFKWKVVLTIFIYIILVFISFALLLHTQTMITSKAFTYRQDDYVFAAITTNLNVINLFLYFLALIHGMHSLFSRNNKQKTESTENSTVAINTTT